VPSLPKLLSEAYFPKDPKAAPMTMFNNDPEDELLIPAKLAIELIRPPVLSPKIELRIFVITGLLDVVPNKLPRKLLELVPVRASRTPG